MEMPILWKYFTVAFMTIYICIFLTLYICKFKHYKKFLDLYKFADHSFIDFIYLYLDPLHFHLDIMFLYLDLLFIFGLYVNT